MRGFGKTGFIEATCLNEVTWMTECAVDSCNMAAFDMRVTRYCCIIIHQTHKTLPPPPALCPTWNFYFIWVSRARMSIYRWYFIVIPLVAKHPSSARTCTSSVRVDFSTRHEVELNMNASQVASWRQRAPHSILEMSLKAKAWSRVREILMQGRKVSIEHWLPRMRRISKLRTRWADILAKSGLLLFPYALPHIFWI